MIEKEDKFLLGQLQDQIRHCLEDGIPSNTGFLDHRQAGLVEGVCRKYPGLRYQMDGGYEEGERKICRMTPEGQEEQVLLSVLRIHKRIKGTYSPGLSGIAAGIRNKKKPGWGHPGP